MDSWLNHVWNRTLRFNECCHLPSYWNLRNWLFLYQLCHVHAPVSSNRYNWYRLILRKLSRNHQLWHIHHGLNRGTKMLFLLSRSYFWIYPLRFSQFFGFYWLQATLIFVSKGGSLHHYRPCQVQKTLHLDFHPDWLRGTAVGRMSFWRFQNLSLHTRCR